MLSRMWVLSFAWLHLVSWFTPHSMLSSWWVPLALSLFLLNSFPLRSTGCGFPSFTCFLSQSWLVPLRCLVGECPCLARFLSQSWLVSPYAFFSLWVTLTRSPSFGDLTCPSHCALQHVSAPYQPTSYRFPDLYLALCPTGCVWLSFAYFLLYLDLSLLCTTQFVSVARSLAFFCCPNLSLPLPRPPVRECPLPALFVPLSILTCPGFFSWWMRLARFLLVCWLVTPSALSSW
jgi:hypothetical protein